MIAEDPPAFTVSGVLASMGDLSQERVIAKHAARQSLVCTPDRSRKFALIGIQHW